MNERLNTIEQTLKRFTRERTFADASSMKHEVEPIDRPFSLSNDKFNLKNSSDDPSLSWSDLVKIRTKRDLIENEAEFHIVRNLKPKGRENKSKPNYYKQIQKN